MLEDGAVHEATDKSCSINFLCVHQKFSFIPACRYLILNFRFTSASSQIILNVGSSEISCSCYSYSSSLFSLTTYKTTIKSFLYSKNFIRACLSFFSLQGIKLDIQLWYPLYSLSQDRKVISSNIMH